MPRARRTYTEVQCNHCHRSFKNRRGLHSHLTQVDECFEAVGYGGVPIAGRTPSPALRIPPETHPPPVDHRARVEEVPDEGEPPNTPDRAVPAPPEFDEADLEAGEVLDFIEDVRFPFVPAPGELPRP